MIFYYSGTGNSLYAAKKLIDDNEKLINIAEALEKKEFTYELQDNEKVGFVFPVYFYIVNDIVSEFIRNLKIKHTSYVYAVITCGASISGAGGQLKNLLSERKIHLSNVYTLVMPDNAMIYYNIAPEEENKKKLQTSDRQIVKIKKAILQEKTGKISKSILTPVLLGVYHRVKGTKKFSVTDACVGCGLCEKNCQEHVIEMINHKPVWKKEKCSKCTACINKCPKHAIQYGRGTKKRNHYYNPYV